MENYRELFMVISNDSSVLHIKIYVFQVENKFHSLLLETGNVKMKLLHIGKVFLLFALYSSHNVKVFLTGRVANKQ